MLPCPPTNMSLHGPGLRRYRDCIARYKLKEGGRRFADLLQAVAEVDTRMRVRFTSPHPKDFPDEVLKVIRDYPNVCSAIHLPAQSGSNTVLERMGRG